MTVAADHGAAQHGGRAAGGQAAPGWQSSGCGRSTIRSRGPSLVDLDRLAGFLIGAARARRTITYGELLRAFGRRPAPRNVAALCRDLGRLEARLRPRGVPDLACLVVRARDGLPGIGWFRSEQRSGAFAGAIDGAAARAHLRACQERAFVWAAGPSAAGAGDADTGADPIPDPGQGLWPTDRSLW